MESADTQKNLDAAYARLEAGESPERVGADFPELRNEIFDLAKTIEGIRHAGAGAYPDKALFRNMLSALPVTESASKRSYSQDTESKKGRSVFSNVLFQIHTVMNTQMKIVLPLAVIVLLAGGVYYFNNAGLPKLAENFINEAPLSQGMPAEGNSSVQEMVATKQEAPSTGNPDDIVADIMASVAQEDIILSEAGADADFAAYDSAVLGEFGQFSYE